MPKVCLPEAQRANTLRQSPERELLVPRLTAIRLGDAVLLLRRYAGLSQTELADRVGVTASAISRIEGRRCAPPASAVEKLATALAVTDGERRWLGELAAHARLLRCVQRERTHWRGSTGLVDQLDRDLSEINRHQEGSEAPI